jgi:hypothetical protein
MIGDWMRHANGTPMQVTRIDYTQDGGHFACGTPHCWEYNNKIEPIPLTEEILKANGFEEHVGEKGAYGVTTAPYFKRDDSPEVFCDGDPFAVWFDEPVDIKYVHQLQHVLRLYGAEKEINIKED